MNEEKYFICLAPRKEDKVYLGNIIISLAQKYGAYPFLPHLTIYGATPGASKKTSEEAVNFALKDIHPFSIVVDKLDYSDMLKKTLFIQFKMNNSLIKIYDALRSKLLEYADYDFNPHMSLIYKTNMQNEEKKKVIALLQIKKQFIIDRCIIISAVRSITADEDVKNWKISYSKTL